MAQAGQREQRQGRGQGLRAGKDRKRGKNGGAEQQHAARKGCAAADPGYAAQNPHGREAQQRSDHRRKGKEQMRQLRRGFGQQGIQTPQKPEERGPLGKPVAHGCDRQAFAASSSALAVFHNSSFSSRLKAAKSRSCSRASASMTTARFENAHIDNLAVHGRKARAALWSWNGYWRLYVQGISSPGGKLS